MTTRISPGLGRRLVLLICALAASGCEFLGLVGPDCAAEPRPGIVVSLVDTSSGERVVLPGGTVVATDGTTADTLEVSTPRWDLGIFVARGTYDVEVTAPGYAPWAREGVAVHEDECGPIATEILAQLAPEA